jgi:hypothetical protein
MFSALKKETSNDGLVLFNTLLYPWPERLWNNTYRAPTGSVFIVIESFLTTTTNSLQANNTPTRPHSPFVQLKEAAVQQVYKLEPRRVYVTHCKERRRSRCIDDHRTCQLYDAHSNVDPQIRKYVFKNKEPLTTTAL